MNNGKKVKKYEEIFLIEDFKTAWNHLGLLDSRRYQIFQYYAAFVGVCIGAITASFRFLSDNIIQQLFFASAILFLVFLVSITSILILKSERKATERYRDKINLIRKVFLEGCENADIAEALSNNGAGSSFEIVPCKTNDLSFINIFKKEKHCTALYIKVLIQVLGDVAIIVSVIALIEILILTC
ncbi:MAG: hypothetical protein COA96_17385 [SAR86 cluster bacterium]|uniref:Uncharacterized protein n=1 Tax=SAR86 cluster bacterium TaxID=2030880 RepID=A0A2A5AGR2_9GAMM|nr:MAG: hypothetical protein COA96_17385 [SAR86 cluster bacterium]